MNFIQDKELIDDAKALGFDGKEHYMKSKRYIDGNINEKPFFTYHENSGYTQEQLRRWLWEKHKLNVSHDFVYVKKKYYGFVDDEHGKRVIECHILFDNPFDAELEDIRKAIEFLKGMK